MNSISVPSVVKIKRFWKNVNGIFFSYFCLGTSSRTMTHVFKTSCISCQCILTFIYISLHLYPFILTVNKLTQNMQQPLNVVNNIKCDDTSDMEIQTDEK